MAAGTDEDLKSVHRLDAGTTGCLVLAKTGASAKSLFTQFKSHMVGKRYLAIVARGEQGWSSESGTIEGFIRPTEEGPQFRETRPSTVHASLISQQSCQVPLSRDTPQFKLPLLPGPL